MRKQLAICGSLLALIFLADGAARAQVGAKALFFDGGSSVAAPTIAARRPAPERATMGVSYWVELIDRNGQSRRVTGDYPFSAGDRVRLHVMPNRDGYLTLINVGSSGQRSVLVPSPGAPDNYVRAFVSTVIPANAYLRFDDRPGVELLQLALSPRPTGMEIPPGMMMPAVTPPTQPGAMLPASPPAVQSPAASPLLTPAAFPQPPLPPAPTNTTLAQPDPRVATATGEQITQGLLEAVDALNRSQAAPGAKDIMLEVDAATSQAASYAVLPLSAVMNGAIVNLHIPLRHQ